MYKEDVKVNAGEISLCKLYTSKTLKRNENWEEKITFTKNILTEKEIKRLMLIKY